MIDKLKTRWNRFKEKIDTEAVKESISGFFIGSGIGFWVCFLGYVISRRFKK